MKTYLYIGVLMPGITGNKFSTSLFYDEETNGYFTQEERDDYITDFTPVTIHKDRGLLKPENKVEVRIGDPFIYSYLNFNGEGNENLSKENKTELIYGTRSEVEKKLLPMVNESRITVHARLMISSFLQLFQATIDLVEETNKDLEKKGVDDKIENDLLFFAEQQTTGNTGELLTSIFQRYTDFNSINGNIRICDIVFLKNKNAFFTNYTLRLEKIVNKKCLETVEYRLRMSELIMHCTAKDSDLLSIMLQAKTECFDFMMQSEYLDYLQSTVESVISDRVYPIEPRQADVSVLEIGIDIDKKIHTDDLTEREEAIIDINNLMIDDKDLQRSMLSIISKMK